MILAFHFIVGAYGFWLPNDPRGSWSEKVRAWELLRFGEATKTSTRESVASNPHDHALRLAAKKALRFPPVEFNGIQARAIAQGFASAVARSNFTIHACSILPEHVHIVAKRSDMHHRQIMNQLKGQSSKLLAAQSIHPFQNVILPSGRRHSPWAEKGWTAFLNSGDDIRAAICYVEQNPIKEGLPPQRWRFVTPYA